MIAPLQPAEARRGDAEFDFPPRFQFSLRNMLIAVAVLAMLLGLFAVVGGHPRVATWPLFFVWILPTPLVVAAVYTRGDIRAFSIGALVPWVSRWTNWTASANHWSASSTRLLLAVGDGRGSAESSQSPPDAGLIATASR